MKITRTRVIIELALLIALLVYIEITGSTYWVVFLYVASAPFILVKGLWAEMMDVGEIPEDVYEEEAEYDN